jgi:hypothetical protein
MAILGRSLEFFRRYSSNIKTWSTTAHMNNIHVWKYPPITTPHTSLNIQVAAVIILESCRRPGWYTLGRTLIAAAVLMQCIPTFI